jgi:hypothetical protein
MNEDRGSKVTPLDDSVLAGVLGGALCMDAIGHPELCFTD